MMREDGLDGGEVMVVVPERTVHMDELFPGAKPLKDTSPSAHRNEVLLVDLLPNKTNEAMCICICQFAVYGIWTGLSIVIVSHALSPSP